MSGSVPVRHPRLGERTDVALRWIDAQTMKQTVKMVALGGAYYLAHSRLFATARTPVDEIEVTDDPLLSFRASDNSHIEAIVRRSRSAQTGGADGHVISAYPRWRSRSQAADKMAHRTSGGPFET